MTQDAPVSSDETPAFAVLTEDNVKAQTDSGSFERGEAYFRHGHIGDTVRRGATIEAQCEGSDVLPYRVSATLPREGEPGENPRAVSCNCPRGGFCKHIVALLLAWIEHPERFVECTTLAEMLGERTREDLISLIVRIVERFPELERLVELQTPVFDAQGPSNVVSIDAALIRRQAESALELVDPYDDDEWGAPIPGIPASAAMLELGKNYLAAGQWANAQLVFTTIAEATEVTILHSSDEEGEITNIMIECDAGLAACLDAQAELPETDRLSAELRERLIATIFNIWRFDVFEAGGLDLAQAGPEALVRNVSDAERVLVQEWLEEEAGEGWSKKPLIEFRIMMRETHGREDSGVIEVDM